MSVYITTEKKCVRFVPILVAVAAVSIATPKLINTHQPAGNSEIILGECGVTSVRSKVLEAWACYESGDFLHALELYKEASSRSYGAINPLLGQVNCYRKLGRRGEAMQVAKSILTLDPMNYSASVALAELYFATGEFSKSAAFYSKLRRLYPEDLAVMSGLAWSYLKQGWSRQAEPLFEKIIFDSPAYPFAGEGLEICRKNEQVSG